jgi:O-antigen ligase
MPKSILGIQGLNPWNILLFFVLLGWIKDKTRNATVKVQLGVKFLLIWFASVIFISHIRLLGNYDILTEWYGGNPPSFMSLFSEQIINAVKWMIPAFLLFNGCDSKERLKLATLAICSIYVLLAIQVIRWMPLSAIGGGEDLTERSIKILVKEVGFHRVNLSMMLAGGFWAVIASIKFMQTRMQKYLTIFTSLIVLFGQSLTGGRTGYATWMIIGLIFMLKRKGLLFVLPVLVVAVVMLVPGVQERMLFGIGENAYEVETKEQAEEMDIQPLALSGSDNVNLYAVTSGRSIAWPYVVETISDSPWVGYGRMSMVITGLSHFLLTELGESFPHPHNAYLEFIIDNGLIGAVPVFILLLYFLVISLKLFLKGKSEESIVAGGLSLSLISAFVIASVGSQSFYPREGLVGMLCGIGIMYRYYLLYITDVVSKEDSSKRVRVSRY